VSGELIPFTIDIFSGFRLFTSKGLNFGRQGISVPVNPYLHTYKVIFYFVPTYMIELELDVIFYINGFTNEFVWYGYVLEAGNDRCGIEPF